MAETQKVQKAVQKIIQKASAEKGRRTVFAATVVATVRVTVIKQGCKKVWKRRSNIYLNIIYENIKDESETKENKKRRKKQTIYLMGFGHYRRVKRRRHRKLMKNTLEVFEK